MAKVHHSAIVTPDVEASLTFWRDGCDSYVKNAVGKIATQLLQTSRWYADATKRFKTKEYERV